MFRGKFALYFLNIKTKIIKIVAKLLKNGFKTTDTISFYLCLEILLSKL